MAWVEHVVLHAGQHKGSKQEFFTVSFKAYFSVSDRRLDIPYRIHSAIFEQDDALDQLVVHRNGTWRPVLSQQDSKGIDGLITWLDSFVLKPAEIEDGQEITLSKDIDVGRQERGEEEYIALVLLLPEVGDVMVYSDTKAIDLG